MVVKKKPANSSGPRCAGRAVCTALLFGFEFTEAHLRYWCKPNVPLAIMSLCQVTAGY